MELKDCGITGYQQSSGPDSIPQESLSLNFSKITFTPSPLDAKGSPQKGAITSYDLALMKTS